MLMTINTQLTDKTLCRFNFTIQAEDGETDIVKPQVLFRYATNADDSSYHIIPENTPTDVTLEYPGMIKYNSCVIGLISHMGNQEMYIIYLKQNNKWWVTKIEKGNKTNQIGITSTRVFEDVPMIDPPQNPVIVKFGYTPSDGRWLPFYPDGGGDPIIISGDTVIPPGNYQINPLFSAQVHSVNGKDTTYPYEPYTTTEISASIGSTADVSKRYPINSEGIAFLPETGYPGMPLQIYVYNNNPIEQTEVDIIGTNVESATFNGEPIPIEEGQINYRAETSGPAIINGYPDRKVNITLSEESSAKLTVNNTVIPPGGSQEFLGDVVAKAENNPITITLSEDSNSSLIVNGLPIKTPTELQVSSDIAIESESPQCMLTIDYGDNSYQIIVPQTLITITAPQRDGWLFNAWTSTDTGITNATQVKCNIDLTGKESAHLVANYERFCMQRKPNIWS